MRRLLLLANFMMALVPQAKAGFEWLPPSQMPAPISTAYESPQTYQMPAPPMVPSDTMIGGLPAAPVMSEPLGMNIPTPISPPLQPVKNLSGKGLFIDPYPLRQQNNVTNQPVELSTSSVEQAMIEQAHILNPLPLGEGMKTGAQPTPAIMPYARRHGNNGGYVPRAPMGGLTPMVGGEPHPLPGIINTDQSAPMAATPIIQYAEAIGFGRDLPLALALSQVVPPEFSHSYAKNVDAGTIISWEGGAPWNQVLENMLKPKGLTASIQGNQVIIRPLASL